MGYYVFIPAKHTFESLQMVRQKESANYHLGSLCVALWRRYMEEYAQLTLTLQAAAGNSTANSNSSASYSLLGAAGAVGGVRGKVELVQTAAMDTLDKAMSCYR